MNRPARDVAAQRADAADAPVWLLLRGLTRETGHWGDFPDRLAAALPGARVIALDLPGNGVLRHEASPASVEAMAEAVRAQWQALAAALPDAAPDAPAPRVNLLAMSLGAMVAVAWASRHPDEVARAVLVNTSLRPFSPPWQRLRPRNWLRLLGLMLPWRGAAGIEATVLRMTSARDVAGGRVSAAAARAAAKSTAPAALPRWTPAQRAALLADWTALRARHPVAPANALRQLLAAARFHAPRTPPPVALLLLGGARDALVDPRCSLRLAAAWGAGLRVHPGAGHDLPLDAPDWVAAQVAAAGVARAG